MYAAVARENARADVAMGAVFLERGEVEPALELFRRATSTDPARMSAWTYIARVGRERQALQKLLAVYHCT